MSKFEPIDETEYAERKIWPVGWYNAEISDAPDGCTEKLSNNGNLMFVTKFKVYNATGAMRIITAYVLADGAAKWQLRACAEAFGVLDAYKAGTLTEDDLKGRTGFVKLAIETDPNGVYDDKNVIRDFRKTMPGIVKASDMPKSKLMTKKETAESIGDSEIPF